MPSKPTVVITGIGELDRRLRALEAKIAKQAIRQGLRAGMKDVQAKARALAPRDQGTLKRDIKVRATKRTRKRRLGIKVQIGENGRAQVGKFYGAFQELGAGRKARSARVRVKAHRRRGHPVASFLRKPPQIKAVHFLERAFKSVRRKADRTARREILAAVERLARA